MHNPARQLRLHCLASLLRVYCLGALLITAGFFSALANAAPAGTQVGSIAPNWVLNDIHGKPVSLYQQSNAGNTTIMVFWTSWCQKCKALLPFLREIQAKKQNRPYQIYIMNIWEDETNQAVRDIAELTVLARADNVARRFGVGMTPGIVVVGPDRRIVYKRASGTSMEAVTTSLNRLLFSPPAAAKTTNMEIR